MSTEIDDDLRAVLLERVGELRVSVAAMADTMNKMICLMAELETENKKLKRQLERHLKQRVAQ